MFKDKISKKEKIMTITLLTIGIIITILGLIKGLNSIDPKYFVLIASLVGLVISGFAIGGKLYQDLNSSKKQGEILDTTILTLEKTRKSLETAAANFELSQKIDTTTQTTEVLSILTNQNTNLLKQQNTKLINLNNEIDKNLSLLKLINETNTQHLKDINNNVTGGEGYLRFDILKHNGQHQDLVYSIRNQSNIPIYDLNVMIIDYAKSKLRDLKTGQMGGGECYIKFSFAFFECKQCFISNAKV